MRITITRTMNINQASSASAPDPDDLPPPYSSVVGAGNPQYGFVVPQAGPYATTEPGVYPHPKTYTEPGVYPHPPSGIPVMQMQPQMVAVPTLPPQLIIPPAVGNEPTTVTCINCAKVVTTRVAYTTAWHTHLVAGSICVMTMVCSMCCLGLVPYCFDTFKDAEHYCPNCNSFLGKSNKC